MLKAKFAIWNLYLAHTVAALRGRREYRMKLVDVFLSAPRTCGYSTYGYSSNEK
jgi:hypothetical protein